MRALGVSKVGWWLGGLGLGVLQAAAPALAAQVAVCHIPRDDPTNITRINIPERAVAAH